MSGTRGPAEAGRGSRGDPAVARRQLRPPLGDSPPARRLPRSASPPPAAASSRRNVPGSAPGEQDQAAALAPGAPVAGRKSQPPGRNTAHCPCRPLHPQGHPKILSNRSAESIFGTHPCARSLCQHGGPDGEGQARGQARGARRTSHCNCGAMAVADDRCASSVRSRLYRYGEFQRWDARGRWQASLRGPWGRRRPSEGIRFP